MPRGRFLNKEICTDKTVNSLSSFESMLAFTWLIPHLDCEGRTFGDPAIVRSFIFPRRDDISIEQVELFIKEWHEKGLIVWYEYEDDKYILFPNFGKHQVGLNKKREKPSSIPIPDELLTNSGITPDQLPVNVNVKLSKVNVNNNVEVKSDSSNNLSNLFSQLTKLNIKDDWKEAEERLIKAGVIENDIKNAVKDCNKKGFNIVGMKSIVNPAIIAMNNRMAKHSDHKNYEESLKKYGI